MWNLNKEEIQMDQKKWETCVAFHGHSCGEIAAENHIHLENGRRLCEDCYRGYDRFHV